MRNTRRRVMCASLCVFASWTGAGARAADTPKFKARFTSEELDLLKKLRTMEENAKMVKAALAVGVFKDIVTGKPLERLYAIYEGDWDEFANAVSAMDKIHACAAEKEMSLFYLNHAGAWPKTDGGRVLAALYEVYLGKCGARSKT